MFTRDQISKFGRLKTPFYFYDMDLLERTLADLRTFAWGAGYTVHYALKANANTNILSAIREAGFGADCVSGNEVRRARESGFRPDQIVFAGVGKTDDEINYALAERIHSFNCESLPELEVIDKLAGEMGVDAPVSLRINPDVDAGTHSYITTGLEENKFGISASLLPDAHALLQRLKHVRFRGIHFHIGSQITDTAVFKRLCLRINEIQHWFAARNMPIAELNVGGGLGVDYHHPEEHPIPDFRAYVGIFREFLELQKGQTIHLEPGRSVVAQCGSLVSRVVFVKEGTTTRFVILDAGMTELIRPALYHSYHKIENLTSTLSPEKYDVVGPVCESSDSFGRAILLPGTRRGDLVAIRSVGAYGEVMASHYNLRDAAPAVYSTSL